MMLTLAPSWHAEVPRQQNEVEGASTAAMVLPSLPEAVQRRERFQMPFPVRVALASDARGRRKRGLAYQQLLHGVPA